MFSSFYKSFYIYPLGLWVAVPYILFHTYSNRCFLWLPDLLSSDGLIKDVLDSEIDFDLWDIDNLQPPNEVNLDPQPQSSWSPQMHDQPPQVEIKTESVIPHQTITHPGLIVSPISASHFQQQHLQQQQHQHQQQIQPQPVTTTIVNPVESPTIRNLLTRNGRVQDLLNGQKIIFHPIGSNVAGGTILVSSNGQPLLIQVSVFSSTEI